MNQEKLLNAIFKDSVPEPKSLRFSIGLEDVEVNVSIKKNKKNEEKKACGNCKCGGK